MIVAKLIIIVIVLFLVVLVTDTFLEEKSPIFKYKRLRIYNKLYKCDNCHLMFRRYQIDLYYAKYEKEHCPHCERRIGLYVSSVTPANDKVYTTEISKPDKWMDIHPDCPKLSFKSAMKMLVTIESLKRTQKDRESIREFEEYNKIGVDLKWIDNLKKKE